MRELFLIFTIAISCWSFSSYADGERHIINVQHYIDLLTPISERQDERIDRLCGNMVLFGATEEEPAGLISEISADRCRKHFELSTGTMHVVLEEYLERNRAYFCDDEDNLRGMGKAKRQGIATFCETGEWEYSTDPKNGTTKEAVVSVTESLIMPALVCAASAREIASEQRFGYCTFIAPPAGPDLLRPWGRLIGQAGMLPLNRFGNFRDDACTSYPSGDPTTPAALLFDHVLDEARESDAMVSRLEALGLECGPSDLRGLDKDAQPDVLCRRSNYLGSRWSRSEADPVMLRAESFGDYLMIGIFESAANGDTRVCMVVGSMGI